MYCKMAKTAFLNALLALLLVFGLMPFGAVAYAQEAGAITSGTGSMSISKTVTGSDVPDSETVFEFTITKDDIPASGMYSVDGATAQAIPSNGTIELKAGQSALLTEIEEGEYVVTEVKPDQSNYESTSFSVNGTESQSGLSATVEVTAVESAGGWKTENGSLVKDDDGYFVYTFTADQLDENGRIAVDCNSVAEQMEAEMRDYQNYSPVGFKVKFVNESGVPIHYEDYAFDTVNWLPVGAAYTPSGSPSMLNTSVGSSSTSAGYGWGEVWQQIYSTLIGQNLTSQTLNATGFDGNQVRSLIAPLRCINPAVVSFFKSNPGIGVLTGNSSTNSAQTITLLQMNALPELIKQAFSFENCNGEEISLPADSSRTYADFLCAFYGIQSLDELTVAQKYNVLGTGYKGSPAMLYAGQSHITTYFANGSGNMANWCIPYSALNDGTLDYFKAWGFSDSTVAAGKKLAMGGQTFSEDDAALYAYQQDYYLMESDSEVLSMAYEYLYDRCIRFTLDGNNRPVSTSIDNSATSNEGVGGIKDYLDKTATASANVLSAMNNGAEIANGESLLLDNIEGYIEVPNAWNQFRFYDFGFELTFKTDEALKAGSSVDFTNTYKKMETPETPGETPVSDKPSTPDNTTTTTTVTTAKSSSAKTRDAMTPAVGIALVGCAAATLLVAIAARATMRRRNE